MAVVSHEFVFCKPPVHTQGEVFELAVRALCGAKRAEGEAALLAALYRREGQLSTFMEGGVCIPHCLCAGVRAATAVIITPACPVPWTQPGELAELVVLLAVPEGCAEEHLRILAGLAQGLMDETTVRGLMALRAPRDIYAVLPNLDTTH